MQVVSLNTVELVKKELIENIKDCVLSHKGSPILFLYSGGSAMQVYSELFESFKDEDLSSVIFAPVDERKDLRYSNAVEFAQLPVYSEYLRKGVTFVDCGDLRRSLEDVARKYDSQMRVLIDDVQEHEGTVISLLGMGIDGHTAGIFAYPENPDLFNSLFVDTDSCVVGYDVGDKNQFRERITLTVPALQSVDSTFVYVTGESKKDVLSEAVQRLSLSADLPATLWHSLKEVHLYTDILFD